MDPLSEAFQHHTWATEQLIRHLRGLPEAALSATTTGVYGEVLATLSHLLDADGRYLQYLEGTQPPPRTGPDSTKPLDGLADQLRDQAVRHGDDHRTQICTVLSANGYEAPDLDVWSYWMDRRAE